MQQNVASYALEGVCGPHDFIVTLVLQRKEERKAEEDDSAKKDGRKAEDDEDESTKRLVVVGMRFFLRALSDQGHEAMERAAKDAGGSSRSFDSRQSLLEFFERLSRRHAANASRGSLEGNSNTFDMHCPLHRPQQRRLGIQLSFPPVQWAALVRHASLMALASKQCQQIPGPVALLLPLLGTKPVQLHMFLAVTWQQLECLDAFRFPGRNRQENC
ncbi:unnamed protein product [Symbiodinium sp. CCMP2456]|nr:unnamed protein product [Symbiodinium sp. CCMP2456]